MSKILSQDEIDALLDNVSKTQSFEQIEKARERSVHLYDFKHPDRVSKDQLRTLRTIHDGFARTFSTHLSTILRTMVDINLLSIDQVAYSEYMMALSEPSCIYIMNSKTLDGRAILEVNPQLSLLIVDRLLGGTGRSLTSELREITLIEQNIIRKIIDRAMEILNEVWHNIVPVDFEYDSYEANPQFVQIAPASEVAVIIFFEILVRDLTYPLNICFPYFVLEPIMQKLTVQSWLAQIQRKAPEDASVVIKDKLTYTKVPLIVRLGQKKITLRELIHMRDGDVIVLDTKMKDDLSITVKERIKFVGRAGNLGKKKAVKIIQSITTEEEKLYE
ncbi:MAG: flagellar motor switch protein FliM [candidate division Zixibacteria bacterium]|nr:flagellar motor switch protein FliM [Candidatus Tariuqbacter arcticus]